MEIQVRNGLIFVFHSAFRIPYSAFESPRYKIGGMVAQRDRETK